MPVATISTTVKVQEQTFQAFFNWLRIAPDFLWHSSPGRNAEGNLHTLPEVSPQGAGRRFETSKEVNIWECMWSLCSIPFWTSFLKKENIPENNPRTLSLLLWLQWKEDHIFWGGARRRTAKSWDADQLGVCLLKLAHPVWRCYCSNKWHLRSSVSLIIKQSSCDFRFGLWNHNISPEHTGE